jgi:spore coat protein U-like protein
LNFDPSGVLATAINQTSTLQIQCTNTTPYNIGLNAGTATGATVTSRKMTSGSNTISYSLFSNPGMTTNWGETVGTDTVASTGTGATQSFTVYGQVPAQSTPAPGSYSDTVTVTVTY